MRCEGWRRKGGAFTLGPTKWSQCENQSVVMLRVKQETEEELSACMECWKEAIERGINIFDSRPLTAENDITGGAHNRN
jgi:hypothetical protein